MSSCAVSDRRISHHKSHRLPARCRLLFRGVLVLNGNRLFGREVKAVSGLCTYDQLKAVFFRRICGCFYDTAVQTILNGRRKRAITKSDKLIPIGYIRRAFRQSKAEFVILRPANLICTTDVNGRNILFCSFVIAEFTLLPILPVFTLPLVGVSVVSRLR